MRQGGVELRADSSASLLKFAAISSLFAVAALVLVIAWVFTKGADINTVAGAVNAHSAEITRMQNEVLLYRTYVETLRSAMERNGIQTPEPTWATGDPGGTPQESKP